MRIIIVGAGPIGCYTAKLLRRQGLDPMLIEEHKQLGRPVHCAGLVGCEVFNKSELSLSRDSIIGQIDGAEIFHGKESFILKRKCVAYVINREIFDKLLGTELNIMYETKFLGFEKAKNGYVVETDKGDLAADVIIGADGAVSRVRDAAGMNGGVRYFRGVQFRIATKIKDNNFVSVYIKKPFFSWIVPENTKLARVGIISENPFSDLKKFLQEIKLGGEIVNKFGGIIPVGSCQMVKDGIALVGDAACQVKPITHGGIFYGMRGAEILADCISKGKLLDYDKMWKKKYGNEIRIALYFKNIYESLSEKELSVIFQVCKMSAKKIETIGDFESHSSMILELIKDRDIQEKLGSVLWQMFKENLLIRV